MTDTPAGTARRSAASAAGGSGGSRARPDRAAAGSWPVRERSLIGPVLGIPPLVAVALAVGLTAVGVIVDLLRVGTVGTVFQIAYGAGCVVAVAWVRRRSIFLPAIQPPLLLAVVVPVLAVLVGAPSSTAGVTEHLLLAGAPLINAFPAMAVTTVLVLLVAGFRLVRQRTGPDDAIGLLRARLSGRGREPSDADDAARRGGGRAAEDARPADRPAARSGRPARRRPDPDAGGARPAKDRADPSRSRTDGPDGSPRERGSRDRGRTSGSRPSRSDGSRPARTDGGSPEPGQGSARGSPGRGGQSRGSRPARRPGSDPSPGDSTRSRRPRPPDPS